MFGNIGQSIGANRVRRNHALEHAAITVITERHPTVFLSGRSNRKGFYIFGQIDSEELRSAVAEAQRRLLGGEADLAIHPRCGTNLAVAGLLSGTAAALAAQLRPRHNRITYSVLASIGALMVAPRLGSVTQRHLSTLADLADLEVDIIERRRFPFVRDTTHWVGTHSS
ncbi:MAG: DUF6391 domain-containing protein [Chloroflexota bacterium]